MKRKQAMDTTLRWNHTSPHWAQEHRGGFSHRVAQTTALVEEEEASLPDAAAWICSDNSRMIAA